MSLSIHHSKPSLGKEEEDACLRVLKSGYLAKGPECEAFAKELAERFGRRHAILTSNGASALHLSLLALKVGSEDVVQCPSYVCTALLNSIHACRAQVHLVDTPVDDFLLSPKGSSKKDTKDSVIIAPQMFGVVQHLEWDNSLPIIEDCAMALGKDALQQGTLSITSFYATKMMATGQGGAILTDRDDLAEDIRDLMQYDNNDPYRPRFNYDMADLSAALGRVQLAKLDHFCQRRQEISQCYDHWLLQHGLIEDSHQLSKRYPRSTLFRYWIRVKNLNECIQSLSQNGIEAKSPVYKPLHNYLGYDSAMFPHSQKAQEHFLSLPFYPDLKEKEIQTICEQLKKVAQPDN